ncbi:hypothetical protein SNE40_005083 [Patella caerulea]|uniref:Uncharacterized protein n=1 Tax=Patella caerulea TaxID=87958 RepID=A0AAN8K6U7_PATCE
MELPVGLAVFCVLYFTGLAGAQRDCYEGCINNVCNVTNGVCSEGCRDGFYGQRCDRNCGECRNKPCDKRTGSCKEGCEAGWRGSSCKQGRIDL